MSFAHNKRPDTYFLQTAIRRGFAAIEARLDPEQGGRPFFLIRLKPTPQMEHAIWDLGDMCARYVDAFILGRPVTGCADYQATEQTLRKQLHSVCDPFANPFMAGRMLICFVDEYLQTPGPETRQRVLNLVADIRSRLTFEADYAFWFKAPTGWSSMREPVFGDFAPYPTYPLGGIVLALSRFVEAAPFPEGEDLLRRLSKFILGVSGIFDAEGHFQGHTHSGGILTSAVGLMRWAVLQHDTATIDRMKAAFDWTRRYASSWGWIPDGLGQAQAFSETCAITDAIHLGLLVARHIDPAYYEVVERFARNQLMENQILRPDLTVPETEFPSKTTLLKAVHGSWVSHARPSALDDCLKAIEGCCLGAGIRGCYLVWEHAISEAAGAVTVNMLISRDSPWVEVISHQPYAGKCDILIHQAPVLRVRLSSWIAEGSLAVSVNRQRLSSALVKNRCVELRGLKNGDVVNLDFPLRVERRTEVVSGVFYEVDWRGNTVVGISPKGTQYPLFEREWMKTTDVPDCECDPASPMKESVHW